MSETEQKAIFTKNLNRLLAESGKTQKEVADAIGVMPQTFNTWTQGIAIPRMGKVQLLADYFGVKKSDLLEDRTTNPEYYLNPETAEIAQEIYEGKELRALFDVVRDISPEDMKTIYSVALALKRKERGES